MVKILAIDDKQDNLISLSAILKSLIPECVIITAQSGPEGIEKALIESPDTILLDIKMPGMDGYEVCRRLKREQQAMGIPVLFISSLDEALDKVRAFNAGGVDYITKPFHSDEVLARVRTHIDLTESKARLERANNELTVALQEIRTLRGFLPICSNCKRIRKSDSDPAQQKSWIAMETFISDRTEVEFTHSICPACVKDLYPGMVQNKAKD